jgi:hypothetical protein
MIHFFAERMLGKILFVLGLLMVAGPLILFRKFVDSHPSIEWVFPCVAIPFGLVGVIAMYWFTHSIAHYMCSENRMFLDAVKLTFSNFKFNLSFVPLIGSLFTPDEDKTKPDMDD